MNLIPISFLAGVLTILTPCVLPLLPVIIGTSIDRSTKKKAIVITTALSVSVILFTLLLKASTLLIDIPPQFWKYFSGGILIVFGIFTLFPQIWNKVNFKLGLGSSSDKLLHKSGQQQGTARDILIGAALGPVFSSCSPTYAIIVATVLPASFAVGMTNLLAYTLGLGITLLILALGGQKVSSKLKWAVNPTGTFKKVLGTILLVVGFAVFFGLDKEFEAYLLSDTAIYDGILNFENNLAEDSLN